MTHEEVMQMLSETRIPFAYDHFAEGESPDPPFICFLFPGSENFSELLSLQSGTASLGVYRLSASGLLLNMLPLEAML